MSDRLAHWLRSLDYPQRRALAGLSALVVVLAMVLGVTALVDDGGSGDAVSLETEGDDDSSTSTSRANSTSSSAAVELLDGSSSTTAADTSTTKPTSTTKKGGTGSPTTKKGSGAGKSGGGASSTTASPSSSSTTTSSVPAVTPDGGSASAVADRFTSRRSDLGLAAMTRAGSLDQVAASWAKHMAEEHDLSHNPNAMSEVRSACPTCSGWAENVGYAMTAAEVWQRWLESPTHQANIDDAHGGYFGVGAYRSDDGYVWIVHVFGRTG